MASRLQQVPATPRRPTIHDVAKAAEVSIGTVSRVINSHLAVSPAVRERVQAAMRALGYVPDAVAQSMRSQATMVVGCMVPEIANPLFARVVSAAEEVLHAASYTFVLTNSRERKQNEAQILSMFRRRRLDGVICTVSREADPETLDLLRQLGRPLVVIERSIALPVDSVTTDHRTGMAQAVHYLLTLGHRRIGMITVTREVLPGRMRAQAFAEAHAEFGVPFDAALTAHHGFSADYGYRTAYEFLSSAKPPTALIAGGGQMGGVLRAVRALQLEIPRDLSIICVGETDLTELHTPPLTTVRWDIAQVGKTAAEILLSRLAGSARPEPFKVLLPTEFVVRRSCAPPHA